MLTRFRNFEVALVTAAALSLAACSDLVRQPPPPPETTLEDSLVPDSTRRDSAAASTTRRQPRPARRRSTPVVTTRPDTTSPAVAPRPAPRPPLSAPIRRDLERLVSAQEQHVANVGRYASRTQYLALRYLPQAGVSLTILTASDSGWAGRGTREGWDGSCVVWVGKVTPPQTARQNLQPPTPGIPLCDPS